MASPEPLILGAGPAGLTAAYVLARQGSAPTVLEAGSSVGGLARTEVRDGYRFDLGGHRFFTKSREVEQLWHDVLGDELRLTPRLSRIHYRGRFLDYPLNGRNVVAQLGPVELAAALGSYLAAVVRPKGAEETFEQWVSNRFGRRLFQMFFASYTEKVWGVPCSELRAEWAAQRIKGLSFASAARSAMFGNGGREVRSLIEEFHYPRLGPGQMWEAMRQRVEELGGTVHTDSPALGLRLDGGRVAEVTTRDGAVAVEEVISSLPLGALPAMADPAPDEAVLEAARGLRYRDFLTVALVLDDPDPFPDNWIYVHEPEVRVARIQNYRAWSPDMVPEAEKSCLGLEYFCFEGDALWSTDDDDLIALGARELEGIGLCKRGSVERGYVVRVPKAYPIYDAEYSDRVACIREWLGRVENLQQVGRNGLHRYNNSDHSMLTAMRAVENLDGARHDLWAVNADSWYHETEVEEEQQPYRRPAEALPETGARVRSEISSDEVGAPTR